MRDVAIDDELAHLLPRTSRRSCGRGSRRRASRRRARRPATRPGTRPAGQLAGRFRVADRARVRAEELEGLVAAVFSWSRGLPEEPSRLANLLQAQRIAVIATEAEAIGMSPEHEEKLSAGFGRDTPRPTRGSRETSRPRPCWRDTRVAPALAASLATLGASASTDCSWPRRVFPLACLPASTSWPSASSYRCGCVGQKRLICTSTLTAGPRATLFDLLQVAHRVRVQFGVVVRRHVDHDRPLARAWSVYVARLPRHAPSLA